MTLQEVYLQGRNQLRQAGIESSAFDTICLFQKFFHMDRQGLILHGQETADSRQQEQFQNAICQRADRRPLQYILGRWDFMGLPLKTGEGVLVPREETELLVHTAARFLEKTEKPQVLDLCAGTGAVGLGLASLRQDAEILCVEWMPEAFSYLEANIAEFGNHHVRAKKANVLQSPAGFSKVDAILSNPPYVTDQEMQELQEEVKREPATALSGGADGLRFYRALVKFWLPLVEPGGFLVVEIGETQGKAVQDIFYQAGLADISIKQDFNGLDRVVSGRKIILSKQNQT